MASKKSDLPTVPHSWAIEQWPASVFPGSPSRGRYLYRAHRRDLIASGVVVRIGRQVVVLGGQFNAWLAKHASRVEGFTVAANEHRKVEVA